MTRTYQKKKIPRSVEKELNRLSSALPKMEKIGVVEDYHYSKLSSIYLRPYKASSAKARDLKVQKEFEVYCSSIYNLHKSYVHQEQKGGFEVFTEIKSDEYPNECVVCKKEELKKVNQFKGDERLICNSCGAFYAKNKESIEVFYEQLDVSVEDVEPDSEKEIDYNVTFTDKSNNNLKVNLPIEDFETFEDTLSILSDEIEFFIREYGDTMKYYNMLPDYFKLEAVSWGIDTPVGDSIYEFFLGNKNILILGISKLNAISSTVSHFAGFELTLFQGYQMFNLMFNLSPIELTDSFIKDGVHEWMDDSMDWFKDNKNLCIDFLKTNMHHTF